MKSVTILGSTGSIGTSTLDVIRRHRKRFRIRAVTTHQSIERALQIAEEFRPKEIVVTDEESYQRILKKKAPHGAEIL
ncbi:MAG: 1-deoxy-D-xylulose-5-phosphate reductoisomerase, partial [Candidatus Aureabacteria bacterium]|nr:1-deoxy-D-xylulose-5-phosphate reductoisomerase [Candidatus Auribacterota bacterium]